MATGGRASEAPSIRNARISPAASPSETASGVAGWAGSGGGLYASSSARSGRASGPAAAAPTASGAAATTGGSLGPSRAATDFAPSFSTLNFSSAMISPEKGKERTHKIPDGSAIPKQKD